MSAVVLDLASFPRTFETARDELAAFNRLEAAPDSPIRIVRTFADLEAARQQNRLAVILASQEASILGSAMDDFEAHLDALHKLGLRVLQLTHNARTPYGDAFMEPRDGGLSLAGARLIALMNERGLLIDLSHCSPLTTIEAAKASRKPVAITHAGVHALAPTRRNKSFAEIDAVAATGGLFGVFGLTTWLTQAPTLTPDHVLAHFDALRTRIGADHMGFGSDGFAVRTDAAAETARMANVQRANAGGPSAEWPVTHSRLDRLNGPDRMSNLAEMLAAHGYSQAECAAIAGGSLRRVLQAVLP
jgi:membrane dipeptidase